MHKGQKNIFVYGSLLFVVSTLLITNLIVFIQINYHDLSDDYYFIYIGLNTLIFLIYSIY